MGQANRGFHRLIFIGRLHPSKGIAEFAEAFTKATEIDVEFLVLGDGPEKNLLLLLAARDNRIRLIGALPQKEVLRWLAQMNIFVSPSYYDGFSIALLEAMAIGHACIVRDIPIMKEVLGREAGILCIDVKEMREAIANLATSSKKRFEIQLWAKMRAREFSWQKSARILIDVYKKKVGGDFGSS